MGGRRVYPPLSSNVTGWATSVVAELQRIVARGMQWLVGDSGEEL